MKGYFGEYGGAFVPETLVQPLKEIEAKYTELKDDKQFQFELAYYLKNYSGRPTALTYAENLTRELGGAKIFLKREDLNHTGAHKINNTMGQALLAKHMGKSRLIAETGAGQNGVATATVAALLGMRCTIFMGEIDMERQSMNVGRIRLLGAEVVPVKTGSRKLKDATSQAIREWVASVKDSYYLLGSALGPHPYPTIVRDFQTVIGREVRRQILEQCGRLPTHLVACIGGGSNAIGLFYPFLDDEKIIKIGVEAGGHGVKNGEHANRVGLGSVGVLHGTKSLLLQDDDGNILPTHSVSAGLDYPAIGPEHANLHSENKAQYVSVSDKEALAAGKQLARSEGIIPALESAHAIAYSLKLAPTLTSNEIIVVNLSGRGDKDLGTYFGDDDE